MTARLPVPSLFSCALLALVLAGCATPSPDNVPDASRARRIALAPTDVLLFGERHDAPGQADAVADVVRTLAARGKLAAVALEMVPQGVSTVALPRSASEADARKALAWNDRAWPWERYGPVVMAAVTAGVPVVGANLPEDQIATAVADVSLDAQLSVSVRASQAAAIRNGHCGLLPENRIEPMVRVQTARDRSMAHVLAESVSAGRVALLLAGAGHADLSLGVPQHLPTQLTVRSIVLVAEGDTVPGRFDAAWPTARAAAGDPCSALALHLGKPAPAP